MQAMIFAAGLGTRLRPLTDTRPKAMVEVAGRPLLEHVILKLKRQGFNRIVVNVHHFGEQIIEFLRAQDNYGIDILVSDERGQLLNTGGGLKRALPLFHDDEPILIHNVDIACDIHLGTLYSEAVRRVGEASAMLVTNRRQTSRFLLFNEDGMLRGWLNEKPDGDVWKMLGQEPHDSLQRLHFTGIHVVMPDLFQPLAQYPGEVFSIIDFYLSACLSHPLLAWSLPDDCRWVDCGRVEMLSKAEKIWTS